MSKGKTFTKDELDILKSRFADSTMSNTWLRKQGIYNYTVLYDRTASEVMIVKEDENGRFSIAAKASSDKLGSLMKGIVEEFNQAKEKEKEQQEQQKQPKQLYKKPNSLKTANQWIKRCGLEDRLVIVNAPYGIDPVGEGKRVKYVAYDKLFNYGGNKMVSWGYSIEMTVDGLLNRVDYPTLKADWKDTKTNWRKYHGEKWSYGR